MPKPDEPQVELTPEQAAMIVPRKVKVMGMMNERAKQLAWAMYLAGFDESGEGFNGEYLHPSYRPNADEKHPGRVLQERLRPDFEKAWRSATEGTDDA